MIEGLGLLALVSVLLAALALNKGVPVAGSAPAAAQRRRRDALVQKPPGGTDRRPGAPIFRETKRERRLIWAIFSNPISA